MVRDGKISSEEYVEILIKNLPKEEADDIVSTQVAYLEGAVHTMTPRRYCDFVLVRFKKTLASRVFKFIVE